MSQTAANSSQAEVAPALESLQRILTAQAEDQELATERAISLLGRFFKLALVIVGLNVVIAGANLIMIVARPRVNVVPTVTAVQPAPEAPRVPPPAPPEEVQLPALAQVAPDPVVTPPAPATPPSPAKAASPQSEKRVPLLGPLPAAKPMAMMQARRPAALAVKPTKLLANAPADDDDDDGRPLAPPERW